MKNSKILFLTILALVTPLVADAFSCQAPYTDVVSTTPDADFVQNVQPTNNNVSMHRHKKTGLIWKKCSEGQTGTGCADGSATKFTWEAALKHTTERNNEQHAGYSDWRLPNYKELISIVEFRCINPTINLTLFPNTPSNFFWTSTIYVAFPYLINSSYVVPFHGVFSPYAERHNKYPIRLVRNN